MYVGRFRFSFPHSAWERTARRSASRGPFPRRTWERGDLTRTWEGHMADHPLTDAFVVGSGPFRYRVEEAWPAFPAAAADGEAVAVACDSRDRVFVFLRGPRPVQV